MLTCFNGVLVPGKLRNSKHGRSIQYVPSSSDAGGGDQGWLVGWCQGACGGACGVDFLTSPDSVIQCGRVKWTPLPLGALDCAGKGGGVAFWRGTPTCAFGGGADLVLPNLAMTWRLLVMVLH